VGTEEHCEGKKVSLLIRRAQATHVQAGRATEDDRDHFGKSDWIWRAAGRTLSSPLRKLTKDVRKHLQRCLDEGKHFNIGAAIKSDRDGLKYSLATGNRGDRSGWQGWCLSGAQSAYVCFFAVASAPL
jgi:DNA-directed RNA polymerase II subunit RPB2